jgi:hypothetical protein
MVGARRHMPASLRLRATPPVAVRPRVRRAPVDPFRSHVPSGARSRPRSPRHVTARAAPPGCPVAPHALRRRAGRAPHRTPTAPLLHGRSQGDTGPHGEGVPWQSCAVPQRGQSPPRKRHDRHGPHPAGGLARAASRRVPPRCPTAPTAESRAPTGHPAGTTKRCDPPTPPTAVGVARDATCLRNGSAGARRKRARTTTRGVARSRNETGMSRCAPTTHAHSKTPGRQSEARPPGAA